MGGLLAIWGFIGKIPFVKTIATYGLVFLAGFAIGNYHATQKAVQRVAEIISDRDAREQAATATALIEWKNKTDVAVKQAIQTQRVADDAAHLAYETSIKQGSDAVARARTQIASERTAANAQVAKLQDNVEGLKAVSGMLADAAQHPAAVPLDRILCGSPDARRLLDEASGARDSAAASANRDTAPEAAGGIDAEAATSPGLTCDQLLTGYVNLSEWGRGVASQLDALQTWEARIQEQNSAPMP